MVCRHHHYRVLRLHKERVKLRLLSLDHYLFDCDCEQIFLHQVVMRCRGNEQPKILKHVIIEVFFVLKQRFSRVRIQSNLNLGLQHKVGRDKDNDRVQNQGAQKGIIVDAVHQHDGQKQFRIFSPFVFVYHEFWDLVSERQIHRHTLHQEEEERN